MIEDKTEVLDANAAAKRSLHQATLAALALAPAMVQLTRVVMRAVFDEETVDGKTVFKVKAKTNVTPREAMDMLTRWSDMVAKIAEAGSNLPDLE